MTSERLIAIPFQYTGDLPRLRHFEELFLFGLLGELGLFRDIHIRDMTVGPDAPRLEAGLPHEEVIKRLAQICQSTRNQYLLTGVLTPLLSPQREITQVKITVRLFSLARKQYMAEETLYLTAGDGNMLNVTVEDFNAVLNQSVLVLLGALSPDEPQAALDRVRHYSLTRNLEALRLVREAGEKQQELEKVAGYEAAIRLDPQMELAYAQLAKLYRAGNEYEKSVLFYRKALEASKSADRTRAVYATEAGVGCALAGKHDVAMQWWKTAIELDPTLINPLFNMANTLEDQNRLEEAEAYFLKAQALAPDDFRTFYNLARLYSKMGAWHKALAQYEKQLTSEEGDAWSHSDVAMCYLNLGDMQKAKEHLEKTVSMDPDGEAGEYAKLILSGIS